MVLKIHWIPGLQNFLGTSLFFISFPLITSLLCVMKSCTSYLLNAFYFLYPLNNYLVQTNSHLSCRRKPSFNISNNLGNFRAGKRVPLVMKACPSTQTSSFSEVTANVSVRSYLVLNAKIKNPR